MINRIGRLLLLLPLAGCAAPTSGDGVFVAALSGSPDGGAAAQPAAPGNGNGSGNGNGNSNPSLGAEMPSTSGRFQTVSSTGTIDATNPFFQSLGSNGRACVSCHAPEDGWSVTPAHLQARFDATSPKGTDPIFRPVDGAVAPGADVSTEAARQTAYAMLLSKGLIRVGIGMPDPARRDFDLIAVDDPYGYASDRELSLFRRPLPSTNLGFLATVMWDGRETFSEQSISFDLADQANGATLGHAQALQALDATTANAIVAFESALFTAATFDNDAGLLTAKQANGGPQALAQMTFHLGINDPLGGDPTPGATFTPQVFHLYDSWTDATGNAKGVDGTRASVARGQALFDSRSFTISGVNGLNTLPQINGPLTGTCTTCHDTPGSGNHSLSLAIDIGIADGARRTPDLPLYTFRHNTGAGEVITTTDPGRALITGSFADMQKFKGPMLRALAARPPYFHNGSAATLDDVVNFYNARFNIGLSAQDHADLVAFLKTL